MDDKKMEELLIDYIDGRLTGELKEYVAGHIVKNDSTKRRYEELKATMQLMECDRQLEPDNSVAHDFEMTLHLAIARETNESKNRRFMISHWQVAAAVVLLVVGAFGGMWMAGRTHHTSEMAQLRKEMAQTKQLVMQSLQDHTSASQRLHAVNVANDIEGADSEIVVALIKTMNEDDNTNVRLAAVEALAKLADRKRVRMALIQSLATQTDVVVQVALINLMVTMEEKRAVDKLRQIIDSDAEQTVKNEAHMAVFKLS